MNQRFTKPFVPNEQLRRLLFKIPNHQTQDCGR